MAYKALLIEGHPTGLQYISNDIKLIEGIFERISVDTFVLKGNAQIIQHKIQELSLQSFANDILIIYFTGHGELKKKKLYLKVENENNFYSDMLSINLLAEILDNSNFSKILFILDCCNASAAISNVIQYLDEDRFFCIYSCKKLEETKELVEYRASAFTYFFTECINLFLSECYTQPITIRNIEDRTNTLIKEYNNSHKNEDIPLLGFYYTKSSEFILFENSYNAENILLRKKSEYFQNFNYCIDNCDKSCYEKFFWCNTIFTYNIDLTK